MSIRSRRTRLAIFLIATWIIVTLVSGTYYVYHPRLPLKATDDEYVAYPDFRTARFLVLWMAPTLLYGVVSLVAIVSVRNKPS